MKCFASHRLYTSPTTCLKMATVTIDETGKVRGYDTFRAENPSTEWIGGIIFLSGSPTLISRNTLEELLEANMLSSESLPYAWHISHYDFTNECLTSQSVIRRLQIDSVITL